MKKLSLLIFSFVIGVSALFAQTIVIKGTVTSAGEGAPAIPGATVQVKGTTIGAATDSNGNYALNVPKNATTLIFSYVGMKRQEVKIAGRSVIDVALESDVLGLNEVVITALGISREKRALGYSVTDIKGATLEQSKEDNLINMFQGKLTGVQITNNSGAIGSSSQMLIRGIRSFGDNTPLWVVDGTPVSNLTTSATQLGGVDYGNAISDLDPENIESVSILKGANAAALYGSRARNGVILITTKRGSNTKGVDASYSNTTMFDQVSYLPTYQNSYGQGWAGGEYSWKLGTAAGQPDAGMNYQDWASERSFKYVDGLGSGVHDFWDITWGPRLDAGLLIDQFQGKAQPWISHPDNVRSFFVTGISDTNNLTLKGGTDNIRGRLSYSNIYETGTIPNTDQRRNSLNASTTMNFSEKLKVDVNLNYVDTRNDNLPDQGDTRRNVMSAIGGWFGRQVDMNLLKEHWREWMPNGYPYNWNSVFADNPYWTVYNNTSGRKRERFFGNVEMNYSITPWLNLMGRYGIDYFNEFHKSVSYEGSSLTPVGTGGSFTQNEMDNKEINADFLATLNKQFSDFKISGILGANYRQNDFNNTSLYAPELTVPNFFNISNVNGIPEPGFFESHYKTNSIYGSLSASFRDCLYLEATLRNDWSSTLSKNSWSYLYPSLSMSWLFTQTFGLEKSFISYGKIRGSYAYVGSDTGPYALNATYVGSTSFNGLSQYNYPLTIQPENLKPEFSKSFEAGTELKFFLNRIGLDFSYYDTKTDNQILPIDISTSSGFSSKIINAGEIESSGYEVSLTGEILRNPRGLNWTATVNWSTQKSQVNKLYPGVDTYILNSSMLQIGCPSITIEARPGEKFGNIYGIGYQRDAQGRMLVKDGFPIPTTGNILLGNIMPDWIASISSEFTYKNLSLSFLIDGRKGGDLFSVTKLVANYAGISEETVKGGIRENGMIINGIDVAANKKNGVRIDPEDWFNVFYSNFDEPGVIDGSFIKLREVVLGYRIPLKINFIRNVYFSIIGRNLALIYHDRSNDIRIDPETAYGSGALAYGVEKYQLPPLRSIGFKLKFDF